MLWKFTDTLDIIFKTDDISVLFALCFGCIWLISGIYAIGYMRTDERKKSFFITYIIAFIPLILLPFAGNIFTYYLLFEFMTLLTFPLVMHDRTESAINAGLKYLFYSIAGAFMSLFGIMLLSGYGILGEFSFGGILDPAIKGTHPVILYMASLLLIVGFGTKAGMFPMHSWLPAAHPEAPAPASAVLSGVITKCGVLGIIRSVYYLIGLKLIAGTWVQTVWIILSLITVFMGSMLAYREKLIKRRLAYSTVSQVSYILFGLAVMNDGAYQGALLHVVFHALIKTMLFMAAGVYIHETGRTKVDDLESIGLKLPVTTWCFLISSIALIGIPPLSGFISKWYIATGAMRAPIGIYSLIGPAILLVSALLTAGYLLPIAFNGFFPKEKREYKTGKVQKDLIIPMIILTAATVIFGILPLI